MPTHTPPAAESSLTALIRRHVIHEWKPLVLGGLVVIMGVITTLAAPQAMKRLIDGLMSTRDESAMIWLLALLALVIAESATRVVQGILLHGAASRIALGVERDAFERFLFQPIPFFDAERSVEMATYLRTSAETLRDFIARELPDLLRAVLRAITAAIALLLTAPRLALYLALTVPPLIALSSRLAGRLKRGSQAASLAAARCHAEVQESFGALRVVRALGVEDSEVARLSLVHASTHAANLVLGRLASWSDGASLLLSESVTLIALGIGGRMVVSGQLTVGELVSFLVYAELAARSTRDLVRFRSHVASLRGVFAPLADRFGRTAKAAPSSRATPQPGSLPGAITLNDVSFSYPARSSSRVLNGVSFLVEPRECLAVVGESGSGKSTLLSLIAGFYAPASGEVLLDGIPPEVGARGWQSTHLAYLTQGARAFSRSIRDNILMGREVDEAALSWVIDVTGLGPLLSRLPGGADAVPGESGAQVSGGEAQRIALARALCLRPAVLLLDEATAALDAESEAAIMGALRSPGYRPTIVIVSHRLSTIRQADRLVLIEAGRVQAIGTHESLEATSRTYRRIISREPPEV